MGRPHALLCASADAPLANWFARLSDIAPDGTVTQITGAGLSGAQRDSMSDPKPLEPGKFYDLDVKMHLTTWSFPRDTASGCRSPMACGRWCSRLRLT